MTRTDYLTNIWKPYPAMPATFLVAGRIYKLEREGELLEVTVARDNQNHKIKFEKAPSHSEFLSEGDLIAVVSSDEIVLLAPQLAALPVRTLDSDLLKKYENYLKVLRQFFYEKDFLEVQTPTLVPCPGTEPSLDVFSSQLKVGSRQEKLFLRTSPELHLKKALALGADKIFEFAPCYRNGEITERHQPEFLMLEWYRAFDNLKTIKEDVLKLVGFLAEVLQISAPKEVKSYSVAELFKIHCHFDFKPETSIPELKALAQKLNVDVRSAESIDDYFFLIFMEKIESQLCSDDLVFVEKYPPYQAALARMTEDGWGDRFEVYWKGYELANAFNELNDPKIQRLRAEEDLIKKSEMKKEEIQLDEEFFKALEAGMPPSGGIALGVDRLFMCLYGIDEISDLRTFAYK
ncbi:EF-P lysine aminoacylase EpmA [Bdellovibrio reynosensis]|uniref:EF-P lysine aminoacylase EpmA n=1 Tax=Bdellovibrio reynosensis TaxID=2835041 RepID=A0ABY4C4K9_9BACT|nr:EF-P lysine aminoacylase EpmA [Bdellovibrio reynosensis]UOE99792.1 EF-P lysine aminoacylase EpmA [Bdellovibrio reynosensis]